MKKHSTFILAFFLFASVSGMAQSFTEVDKWLDKNSENLGGRAILMVYKDGKMVYTKSVSSMTSRQKMGAKILAHRAGKEVDTNDFTTKSRQPIASCSKWLSAALVMSFIDEGKLKLSDTIGKWLPVMTEHGKGRITISQCLSHTTGIKAAELKESLKEMKEVGSMDEAIQKIAELPMEGAPGKVFHYSNAGLQIAAAVIEKISSKDFETLFAERIAQPLEMKNTDFGKGKVPLPAGGAQATPEDYMNFLVMILNKGTFKGKRVLSENSVKEMQVNRLSKEVRIAYSPSEAGDFGYGYGEWVVETSTRDNITTSVSSPGLFGSFPWVNNEKGYCAFLMTVNLKNQGRNEKYKELKKLVDGAL